MENEKPTVEDIAKVINVYAQICHKAGVIEAKLGLKDSLEINFPVSLLKEMINDVAKADREREMQEIAKKAEELFKKKEVKIEKTKITIQKEEELIQKYGKKEMEKLAKQMKFRGQILNTKIKQHAN